MTAIWSETTSGWTMLSPAGFPDEKSLQALVAEAPDLLPLSDSPRVAVLGREVRLGTGYIDVLAIEPTGRPVLIEVKLRNNSESRRAVVAQVLAYAAALHGMSASRFESDVLAGRLGDSSLVDAVGESVQVDMGDGAEFRSGLDAALGDGGFRLVLVLDQAPQELVRLVGYLETMTRGLVIDLVTITSYDVGGRRVVVPQRVEPDARIVEDTVGPVVKLRPKGELVEGLDAFEDVAAAAPVAAPETIVALIRFGETIRDEGLAQVSTYLPASGDAVLLPRLRPDNAGLVSAYCYANGKVTLQFWRSVFERRAPDFIAPVEKLVGSAIGKGTMTTEVSDPLLALLLEAYRATAASTPTTVG